MDMTCENRRPKETPKNGPVPKKSSVLNLSPKNTKTKTSQPKKRTLADTTKKANEVNLATKKQDSAPKNTFFTPPTKKTDNIASLPVNKRPESVQNRVDLNSITKQ